MMFFDYYNQDVQIFISLCKLHMEAVAFLMYFM